MATREIVVNMVPGGVTPVIHVSQYDDGYGITANLIENSGTYTVPVGATVSIEGTKPDGHGYAYLCTYQDNAVVIPVNTQMTAVKGKHPCELVVRKEGLRVGSKNMIMAVEVAGLGEDTIISDTELPAIIALAQEQEEAAQEAAEQAQEAAAEVLSSQIVTEASGSIAAFSDGANDVAVKSLVATITPVQSGSGDPSPSNVRPISGRTGMTVTRCGKNLLVPWITSQTHNGVTYVANADGTFTTSGTASANSQIVGNRFRLPAGTYMLSGCPSGGSGTTYYLRALLYNGETLVRILNSDYGTGGSFTIAAGEANLEIVVFSAIQSGNTVAKTWSPMIEAGSTATPYTPYVAPTTYPISWQTEAGTIYGGTLNVTTGVLTVDRVGVAITNTSYQWSKSSTYSGSFYINSGTFSNLYDIPQIKNGTPFICSHAKTVTRLSDYVYGCCYMDGSLNIRIMDENATAQDWLNYLASQVTAGTPVQVCCKLDTPQTYQLTPISDIKTLLGGNSIYTDAGEVSVEYVADTKLYIDNKIAELQALVLEN